MSLERLAWFAATVCVFALLSLHSAVFLDGKGLESSPGDVALGYVGWAIRYTVMFGPVLVAVTIADNVPVTGATRVVVLAAALFLGAQFQWPIRCLYEPWEESACRLFHSAPLSSWLEMFPGQTLWTICWTATITLAYFYRRRDVRVAEALHAAELARADVQRRTLEAGLQTMQARVEPAFLFDTLGDIGELFEREPALGERMLDELIAYLRAALPDMRAANSTVGREIALARAYLAILQLRLRGALDVESNVPQEIGNAVMPTMTVLPLVTAAIDARRPAGGATTSIRIEAMAEPRRIRIAIVGRGPALRSVDDAPVIGEIRERLRTVYGDQAALAIDVEPRSRLTATLEIPSEAR